MTDSGVRIQQVLARIIEDLPSRRDWLDPALEAEARELLPRDVSRNGLLIADEEQQLRLKNFAAGLAALCREHHIRIAAKSDCLYLRSTVDSRPATLQIDWPFMAELHGDDMVPPEVEFHHQNGLELLEYSKQEIARLTEFGIVLNP